ncbi:MAG: alcohol dehydrogenase catalytic domain-containing protein [Gemmatimonadetes bacterium]|nr:alcohol dehydrogenase catalytic domain-containing protein [Gemmatimonadota bacterium]
MKAATFHEFGGPEVIRIEDVPRPAPGPGEVLVEVRAAALNHLDLWVRRGLPIQPVMPHIGGSDIAGVVVELGPGVGGVEVGERVVVNPSLWCGRCEWCLRGEHSQCAEFAVLGEHTQGGFAEYVTVPASNLYRVPADYPFEQAAAAPLVFLTAWRGLITRAGLRAGQDVLITGASGGVATAAVQIARLAGARVFAVTTGEHVARVRELGAHIVYDRTAADYSREVWRDTGKRGVDVVFDSVGQAMWPQNLRALARGGRLVTYGATTGSAGETDLRLVFWKQLQVVGTTMGNRTEFETVMALVLRGELRPVVDVIWPLERAREAHERLERGEQFGKIVLSPGPA